MHKFVDLRFETGVLDTDCAAFLKELESAGKVNWDVYPPKVLREMLEKDSLENKLKKTADNVNAIENTCIDNIPVRIYTPYAEGQLPCLVFFHGGGWVIGSLNTVDNFCRNISNRVGCKVISVDYSLSPEAKFPVAFNECTNVTKWVFDNSEDLNIDFRKIITGGDSAGGNLAAAVALKLKDDKSYKIRAQLLLYPALDLLSLNYESYQSFNEGYFLTKEMMGWFIERYLQKGENKRNIFISPLLAEDFSNLTDALIVTAEFDPLRDEGEEYAAKLKSAGVNVKCIRYNGMIHGFMSSDGLFKKVDLIESELAEEIKNLLE